MPDPVIAQPTPPENPVIKSTDEESLNLLRMSEEADQSTRRSEAGLDPVPAPEPVDETEVPRDEQGRFIKADGTKSAPNEDATQIKQIDTLSPDKILETKESATDVKEDSAFTKAKKEAERRQKTWMGLQEERAEIARERAAVQAERDRVAQERAQKAQEPVTQKFSSAQYTKVADDFIAEGKAHKTAGNIEEAADAFALAAEARAAARGVEQQEEKDGQQRQQSEFQKTFSQHAAAFAKEVPDVQNPESEVSKELVELFNEEPMLNYHPDGVRKGYELLQLRKAGSERDQLKAKVAELQTELNRYKGITELGGAPPAGQTSKKSFEQMSSAEQSAALQRLAEEADAA